MTPKQTELVRSSFAKVLPIAEVAAELFYARLFELDPSLRHMFRGDMKEQGRKLMGMIRVAVANLEKLDEIVPAVQALGARLECRLVPPGTLPRSELKSRRLIRAT